MSQLALVGGELLNPGDAAPQLKTVLVKDGFFVEILPPGQAIPSDYERFDATGQLMIPGLINAHMHSHANLLRGLCDSWCLEMSLTNGAWMAGKRDPDEIYASTLLGAYEMISNGVTACYDLAFEYPSPSVEGVKAMAAAYRDAGMRAWIAPMIADRPFVDVIPGMRDFLLSRGFAESDLPKAASGDGIVSSCREIFDTVDWVDNALQPAIAPTIALHCTSKFMVDCKKLADEFGARIHMHVAESRVQAQAGLDRYGHSILVETERLGLLDERFTAAHGVWLTADDFRRLRDNGANLVHMPGSNLRLGCGVASIRRAIDSGLAVGLATDGANSSDSLSVFRAMHLAAMVSRVWGSLPESWLASADVFRMATLGNAAVLGQEGKLGKVETGYRADCALIDLDTLAFTPDGDRLNQLVNAESGSDIRSVMVDGKWVLQERRPTRFDSKRARQKARQAGSDCSARNAELRKKTEVFVGPIVEYTHAYGAKFEASQRYIVSSD